MRKPDSLRAAITAMLPELGRDPDRLRIWADKGRIRSTQRPDRGFVWEYTLNVAAIDFTGHPSILFLAVNDWLRVNQPELLAANAPGYAAEFDIIDDKTIDLLVELDLTEQVVLTPREGGGFDLEHIAEPDPLFSDYTGLTDAVVPLSSIWLDGQQLIP